VPGGCKHRPVSITRNKQMRLFVKYCVLLSSRAYEVLRDILHFISRRGCCNTQNTLLVTSLGQLDVSSSECSAKTVDIFYQCGVVDAVMLCRR